MLGMKPKFKALFVQYTSLNISEVTYTMILCMGFMPKASVLVLLCQQLTGLDFLVHLELHMFRLGMFSLNHALLFWANIAQALWLIWDLYLRADSPFSIYHELLCSVM